MIDKSEMKKSIFHSAGCDADDWLEGARRTSNAFEGAKKALAKSSQDMMSISTAVKRDLDDGKMDKMEPSEIADYAILQVTRCRDSLMNAAQHYENRQLAAQGEISAYEKVVGYFQKLHDREDAKIRGLMEAIESGEIIIEDDGSMSKKSGNGNLTGVRPSSGLAAQRKAEAAAESSDVSSSDDELTQKEDTSEESKKKRRKRKPKKDTESVAEDSEVKDGKNSR